MRARLRHFTFALLFLVLFACRGSEPEATSAAAPREDKLVVFAAASLREVFSGLAEPFKQAHPGVEVTFNFAGSQELRTQLEQGAAADIFASADQRHMGELRNASRVNPPVTFARNEPVLVVATEKAAGMRAFADLPRATKIVIGVPEVPIGRYTLQILDNAKASLGADFRSRVEAHVVSRELNVKQVLAKVTLGEAEAGIVYRTDANTAGDKLSVVTIPAEVNVVAEYPIASVTAAPHPQLAAAWIELVLSASGQAALQAAGFGPASVSRARATAPAVSSPP